MAEFTTNYNLRKPESSDFVTVSDDVNANFDTIDTTLKSLDNQIASVESTTLKRVTVAETRTSTTTMSASTALTAAVVANTTYQVRGVLLITCPTASVNTKTRFAHPASSTLELHTVGKKVGDTGVAGEADIPFFRFEHSTATPTADVASFADASLTAIIIDAILIVGATAGNLTLEWAQNVSNASAATLNIGSWLLLEKVA